MCMGTFFRNMRNLVVLKVYIVSVDLCDPSKKNSVLVSKKITVFIIFLSRWILGIMVLLWTYVVNATTFSQIVIILFCVALNLILAIEMSSRCTFREQMALTKSFWGWVSVTPFLRAKQVFHKLCLYSIHISCSFVSKLAQSSSFLILYW